MVKYTKTELARFTTTHSYAGAFDGSNPQAERLSQIRDAFQRTDPQRKWTTEGGKFTLGKGADGSVRLAFCLPRNQVAAVKSMAGGDDSPGNREATLHGRVQSDYVVALYDIFHVVKTGKAGVDVPKIYMSMECGGPSLWALAESGHRFREEEIVQIVRDVLRGMMDCHTVGVLARDVRMRNIIKVDDKYKIIDFGAAIDVNDTATMEMWCITDLEHGRRQCFQEVVELAEDLFSFSDTPPSAAAKEFMQLTAGSDEVNALARLQQHSFLA